MTSKSYLYTLSSDENGAPENESDTGESCSRSFAHFSSDCVEAGGNVRPVSVEKQNIREFFRTPTVDKNKWKCSKHDR